MRRSASSLWEFCVLSPSASAILPRARGYRGLVGSGCVGDVDQSRFGVHAAWDYLLADTRGPSRVAALCTLPSHKPAVLRRGFAGMFTSIARCFVGDVFLLALPVSQAIGGNADYVGDDPVDDSALPAHMMVDWVRVYQTPEQFGEGSASPYVRNATGGGSRQGVMVWGDDVNGTEVRSFSWWRGRLGVPEEWDELGAESSEGAAYALASRSALPLDDAQRCLAGNMWACQPGAASPVCFSMEAWRRFCRGRVRRRAERGSLARDLRESVPCLPSTATPPDGAGSCRVRRGRREPMPPADLPMTVDARSGVSGLGCC